jgi:DNA processing protein
MTEREALIALNMLPRIGPIRVSRLISRFGSAAGVLAAPESRLRSIEGIGNETGAIIHRWEDHTDLAREISDTAERGIEILTPEDELWPAPLREIPDAPVVLYVWGTLEDRDRHALAVVGSRRTTHYGRDCAHKLSFQLAGAGFTIISGLARGIDTAAHEGALAAQGRTVAVLGSGLAKVYPPENMALAQKIADGHGALVSEFPLLTSPDQQTFPQRNRIVAGWCSGLLVIECPRRSGALITANLANEYGRQVYAVPGPIDRPSSEGCNTLIRNGAPLVSDGSQILDDLSQLPLQPSHGIAAPTPEPSAPAPQATHTEDETLIHQHLGHEEWPIDKIVESTGLPAQQISACLLQLEMKQLVKQLPGSIFTQTA